MIDKDRHIDITDAELQQILDDYAEASLCTLEHSAPPDLEARLDVTISGLATRSRRRRLWLRTTAAAASVALLLTAGIGFMSHQNTLPDSVTAKVLQPDADSGSLIPEFPAIASTSSAEDGYRQETEVPAISRPAATPHLTGNIKTVSLQPKHTAPKRTRSLQTNHLQSRQMEKISEQLTANGIADRITSTVSVASITPQLSLAVTVPDILPSSPAETASLAASREMSKVMESLDKVNAVFYEARKIASSLSEDVAYAATSPLRSI